jgi:hypothetical protein
MQIASTLAIFYSVEKYLLCLFICREGMLFSRTGVKHRVGVKYFSHN